MKKMTMTFGNLVVSLTPKREAHEKEKSPSTWISRYVESLASKVLGEKWHSSEGIKESGEGK